MAQNLGTKCANFARKIILASQVKLLVRNTQGTGQPTQMVACMPQQMRLDQIVAINPEGGANAAVPNPTRFLFLPGATVQGVPIAGNMEVEYDGHVWELLDSGGRDLYGVTVYRVFIGTWSRAIS